MKICIYGAGAIGGWLGGTLAKAGVDVSLVARGAHLAAMQEKGLTVEAANGSFTIPVRATDDPRTLGPQDAVVVTLKAPSLAGAAEGIGSLLRPDTQVAFLTNGIPWWYFHGHGGPYDGHRLARLDPKGDLWRIVGPHCVAGGVVWPACAVPEPGVVRLVGGFPPRATVFGTTDGSERAAVNELADVFQQSGIPAIVSDRIRDLIWEKLTFNWSAGPLCVLTTSPVRVTQEDPRLAAASASILDEAATLIDVLGARMLLDIGNTMSANTRLGHRPSILQDLMAGRPMEVDALYTVPMEMAEMAGVAMPVLSLLVALIKLRGREAGLYGG